MNSVKKDTIQYDYVNFEFDWQWIKNKTIIHRGNQNYGMLMILDEDGNMAKMFGYELMKDEKERRQ